MAEEECPMERFCKLVGSRWGCVIVKNLMHSDEVGFNELLRQLNSNPKTLSTKLKALERNGLIKRRVLGEERPIRVLYSLTNRGKEARKVEEFISNWLREPER
jgi:DNA-binding HxlR family transcriptional regulator